jgi:hypothetical protein
MKKFITCTRVIVFVPESPDVGWISPDVSTQEEKEKAQENGKV